MELTDHSLRQMDENTIRRLPEAALQDLAVRLLKDLKEARDRLNQNSRNSSRPPGSDAPWDKVGEDSDSDSDDARLNGTRTIQRLVKRRALTIKNLPKETVQATIRLMNQIRNR